VQHIPLPRRRFRPSASDLRRSASRALLCLLAVTASGCSLVPAYHRPDMQPMAAWNTTLSPVHGATAVRSGWWRSFGSAELDQLMARSLSGSYTLQAAIARIREAEGTAAIDAAPLWPAVALTGTQDQASGTSNSHTHQVLAQASYEIDFWGKNHAAAASGSALVRASAFDADTVAMTLSASVADMYFSILSLRERVRLAQQIASDARRVLGLIEVQRSAGTATDLQIQQQETAVATFDAAVPALQQQMDVAIHALAVLTGQAPEGFGVGAETLSGLGRPDVRPDLPATLMARRPDIQAAEARLISANFNIGVARAAFFPSVSLTAALGVGSNTLSHFFPATVLTDVGAELLQPLFLGGQLEGQLKVSREMQIELVATYRQTVLTAFQDVEDALSTLDHVRVQEQIETRAVAAAQKAADLARLQYSLGSADYLSVLTTEEALYQARDALLQLNLLHLQAIVGLCRALGGGFTGLSGPTATTVAAQPPAPRSNGDPS
jgi:NodT family efflux transporter outer membrane factor (OMF) lipoprotein